MEVHKRYYLPDAPDPAWIADSSSRGWAIISGDKGIEYDGVNRYAVVLAKAKVFLLTDTSSRGAEWAASLVMARHKIISTALENTGPFYCTIDKGGDSHCGVPRFLEGGGPVPKPEIISEAQIPVQDTKNVEHDEKPDPPKNRTLFGDESV